MLEHCPQYRLTGQWIVVTSVLDVIQSGELLYFLLATWPQGHDDLGSFLFFFCSGGLLCLRNKALVAFPFYTWCPHAARYSETFFVAGKCWTMRLRLGNWVRTIWRLNLLHLCWVDIKWNARIKLCDKLLAHTHLFD